VGAKLSAEPAVFGTQVTRTMYAALYGELMPHQRLALIIHAGSWLPLTARSAVQMAGILLCGYDGLPAGGPVLRGSTDPE
jgi:hypothetical protein